MLYMKLYIIHSLTFITRDPVESKRLTITRAYAYFDSG